MAARFGGVADLRAFQQQVLTRSRSAAPPPDGRWWVVPGTEAAGHDSSLEPSRFPGHYLDALRLRAGRFRIPPRELEEMLPQQSLMLEVAADAIENAGGAGRLSPRSGVLIGLGLDQNTNNYQLRWWIVAQAAAWNRRLGLELTDVDLEAWIDSLQQAVSPALSANRTMGSLGGLVASRIAREYRIGGPSFSVSCDENSGTQALQVAVDMLQRGQLDTAIVGAVDLAGDLRAVLAASRIGTLHSPGEGAAALVLKRLDDACRDGDRVYAAIREAQAVTRSAIGPAEADETILSSHGSIGSVEAAIGRPGAATALAAVVRASLCVYQQMIPGHKGPGTAPVEPQFWLGDPAEGPRTAQVRTRGLGGTAQTVTLEAVNDGRQPTGVLETERAQPLGARALALFALEADDRAGLRERIERLEALAGPNEDAPIEALARRWHEQSPLDSAGSWARR